MLSELDHVAEAARRDLESRFKMHLGLRRLHQFMSKDLNLVADEAATVLHIDDRPPTPRAENSGPASRTGAGGGFDVFHFGSADGARTISGQGSSGLSLALRPPDRPHPEVQAELEMLSKQILKRWEALKKVSAGELSATVASGAPTVPKAGMGDVRAGDFNKSRRAGEPVS